MSSLNAVTLLDTLLREACHQRASDIHLEPKEKEIQIRYRVDGILQASPALENTIFPMLATRIKVMAGMDTSQQRLPQDGRFTLENCDFRISTMPTVWGEKIVIRRLDQGQLFLKLDELGMPLADYQRYRRLISRQRGLILVTGPTGCGKTTTLYASLQEILSSRKNIMTLEDPIEYQIEAINQIQINEKGGLTFPVACRSMLRQDPDIIMIGEIRDLETAQMAVRASLTGHLVLSTLHTNSAVGTIIRLVDMGLPPYLIAAALTGVVAQRLVRKAGGGRIGLFETLIVSGNIQQLIKTAATEKMMEKAAVQEGMHPLREHYDEQLRRKVILKDVLFE